MIQLQAFTAGAAILLASAAAPALAQDHAGHGPHGEAAQMSMADCRAMHERMMGDAEASDEAMPEMDEETRTRMQACHAMMHADGQTEGHMQDHMEQHMERHMDRHHADDEAPQGDHGDHHG